MKDAGADRDSKEDKIGPLEDDKPLDAEKGLPTVIPTENAEAESNSKEDMIQPGGEGNMDETETPKDAENGLPTVIPTKKAEAETDPRQGGKSEEGKRSEASKSKCSMLQSLIFGSLQKFFMAQVRNKSITPPPIMSSTL